MKKDSIAVILVLFSFQLALSYPSYAEPIKELIHNKITFSADECEEEEKALEEAQKTLDNLKEAIDLELLWDTNPGLWTEDDLYDKEFIEETIERTKNTKERLEKQTGDFIDEMNQVFSPDKDIYIKGSDIPSGKEKIYTEVFPGIFTRNSTRPESLKKGDDLRNLIKRKKRDGEKFKNLDLSLDFYESAWNADQNNAQFRKQLADYKKALENYNNAKKALEDCLKKTGGSEGNARSILPEEDVSFPDTDVNQSHILDNVLVKDVISTGQTTGHIADLYLQNKSNNYISLSPQLFFIPSTGRFQSYVGRIPEGITVAPNQSSVVPVEGYCADVRTPPVPTGESMTSIQDWVTIAEPPQVPEPMNPPQGTKIPSSNDGKNTFEVSVVGNSVPPFTQDDIQHISKHESFQNSTTDDDSKITVTFPGTSIPVGGTFNPNNDPETFGPVIIDIWEKIELASYDILDDPEYYTPFSSDSIKEHEAVVQQTLWIVMAELTGFAYEKEDFSENVYNQYSGQSGLSISDLPVEQKEKIDSGVDEFWNVFMATGVEAKVFSTSSEETEAGEESEVEKPRCKSNGITFDIYVTKEFGGRSVEVYSQSVTAESKKFAIPVEIHKDDAEFTVKISNIKANCFCECEGENQECNFYPRIKGKSDADLTKPGKIRIRGISTKNTEEVDEDGLEAVDEFELELTVIDKEKDFELVFKTSGYCVNDNCIRATLNKKITLQFERKEEKKDE